MSIYIFFFFGTWMQTVDLPTIISCFHCRHQWLDDDHRHEHRSFRYTTQNFNILFPAYVDMDAAEYTFYVLCTHTQLSHVCVYSTEWMQSSKWTEYFKTELQNRMDQRRNIKKEEEKRRSNGMCSIYFVCALKNTGKVYLFVHNWTCAENRFICRNLNIGYC